MQLMCRWVCPAVCEQYGIASSADDAWESNGGGKFSFKIDKNGNGTAAWFGQRHVIFDSDLSMQVIYYAAIPAGLKSRGWSDARAFSSTQLKKNPNAYFYRHVAPHEQQVFSSQLCYRLSVHGRHQLYAVVLIDAGAWRMDTGGA